MEDQRIRHPLFTQSFGLLFLLLVATLLLLAVAGDSTAGRIAVLVVVAAATWQALRASHVRRRVLRLAVPLIPIATLVTIVLALVGSDWTARVVTSGLILLLVVVAPLAIARYFVDNPYVGVNTFFAAVSVYLLVAMFFATLYSLAGTIGGAAHPFFAQHTSPDSVDYLYFSLTTITTTGYGDFTAAGGVGRMTAMLEAIFGQLYLITVVALVVQNLSQLRQDRRRADASQAPDAGAQAGGAQAGGEASGHTERGEAG
jgi:hypothetical protein